MASNLQAGEMVYVPAGLVGEPNGVSLVRRQVLAVAGRSADFDTSHGGPVRVASSKVHRNVGVLVLSVGDLQTEATLLDPLGSSVLQYFRLLLPDDQIVRARIRTRAELESVWHTNHGAVSHVVLVGHGRPDAFHFVDPHWMLAADLSDAMAAPGVVAKEFISLACQTGRADFGKPFSESAVCSTFIAPFQNIHGATASMFCQLYFTARFLGGSSVKVAFRLASKNLGVGGHFRLWQAGDFVTSRA